MDENEKQEERAAEAAKKKKDDGEAGAPADDKTRIKELEKENAELKKQVASLQKRVEELEAEQQAASNRSRAQKLLRKMEKQGMAFETDEDREAEFKRLALMSDEAFAATEAAYERMIKARSEGAKKEDKAEPPPKKEQSKAEKSDEEPAMRSDAGVRPKDVDDHKATLEDKLKAGFMVAYRHRVATATGERAEAN